MFVYKYMYIAAMYASECLISEKLVPYKYAYSYTHCVRVPRYLHLLPCKLNFRQASLSTTYIPYNHQKDGKNSYNR